MAVDRAVFHDHEWYKPLVARPEERDAFVRCQMLTKRYNQLAADQASARREILVGLCREFGAESTIAPRLKCVYGYNLRIGRHVHINSDPVLSDDAAITIGDYVRMGPRVQLLTAMHPVDDYLARREGWERTMPINVGEDVWLGAGVIVCPGVTVGPTTVVGAGSVVTRDIPAGVLAAGNPCRTIRPLGSNDVKGKSQEPASTYPASGSSGYSGRRRC